jgi:aminodeoxyfutalosine deaminase
VSWVYKLSHLKGIIPQKTGLPGFANRILSTRSAENEVISTACKTADKDMYSNGIVAVGDISNTRYSFQTKSESKIYYHTFIELTGFLPEKAEHNFNAGLNLSEGLNAYYKKTSKLYSYSVVPHAPYSVSEKLMKLIAQKAIENETVISIHNQECNAENEMFLSGAGKMIDFLKQLGLQLDSFIPSGKTSLQTYFKHISNCKQIILVHNTFTSISDILFVKNSLKNTFFCLCPNANKYIENTLPDVNMLRKNNCKIVIGTDSLASNLSLSVLNELKTLQASLPEIPANELLTWATKNGAESLNIQNIYGSFEKGKRPGIINLSLLQNNKIDNDCRVNRIM